MFLPFLRLPANVASTRFKLRAGFSLIELLVAVSIMIAITAIVFANHGNFSSQALLRSQAFDMALRFREIQQTAVSASGLGASGFNSFYGIRWESGTVNFNFYQPFSSAPDTNGNYNVSSFTPFGPRGTVDEQYQIVCVEFVDGGVGQGCLGVNQTVDIVFQRPNFDAVFYNAGGVQQNYAALRFHIGPRGTAQNAGTIPLPPRNPAEERRVTISASGQISVE
jgi:prepilin-type N-terminal cleavage/methylation domain-containing protein